MHFVKSKLAHLFLLCSFIVLFLFPYANVQAYANEEMKPLNIAHRGASGYAPEHTMVSYQLGDDMGADYIEIDLQLTKDGHLIAFHDETLDRTTTGSGKVSNHTLKEIKELDAGSWFNKAYPAYAKEEYKNEKVPTLDEILSHFGSNKKYYIETKGFDINNKMEKKLLASLEKHGLLEKDKLRDKHIIIQSFNKFSLLSIKKMNSDIPLVRLLAQNASGWRADLELNIIKRYAMGVGLKYKHVDASYIAKARALGLEIHPYTVNETEDMERLLDWGVTGIFSNYPDRLQKAINEH
ncbi:glycerophosphodiester phosphodiesterase [Hazenella sp. IB182357]|uniref:Glycerophosphodiester phosphodiesterase n=1 Tax=Polycladospora coralii TaxID=2771432 RepID=A0A926NEB9_9BACL|nr:glycerophosphodiester phosphodiesterase [Polycladospora coralii]MBD1373850.1 glycerophosphodiester phosphodiesterase [Polycladospora coralii]